MMASTETLVQTVPPLTILTENERDIAEGVYQFAVETIGPKSAQMDRDNHIDPDLVKQFFDLDLMGIEIPEEFGGLGQNFTTAIAVIEALARVDAACAVVVDVQNTLVANALLRWGSPELKKKYLPQLAKSKVGSYALSEAGSGSDAFALATGAVKKGDKWVLNGEKLWITNGLESELFLVFANVDKTKGYKGITAFLVESQWKGFTKGKKEDKLGIRASSTLALSFEDLEVPEENVVGKVGEGYKVAIETLNEGRIGIGAQMLGIARAALDYATKYVKQRVQFGKPLAEFQAIQHELARMDMELECARLAVYNAARMKESGRPFLREAAIAKLKASEVAEMCASRGLELLGGYGYVKDYPLEKLYRDCKIGKLYEGTSFMQLGTIAKEVLRREIP
jgi:alkylation response protein AidB-like acyl-CoA dehydrogenase